MTPRKKLVGGLIGVAVGAAIGAALSSNRKRADDPHAAEPFGRLPTDRTSTVTADDGTAIAVSELDPADAGNAHAAADLTVVFVHGLALSSGSWHFQRKAMAGLVSPRVRQVCYDHRGHGRSGPAGRGSTIDQLARDLHAVLRSVVPAGPIVLIGHSIGGMTIMALAEQQPELFGDRIRGIALLTTSAGGLATSGLPQSVLIRYSPLVKGIGGIARWQPGLVELARTVGSGVIGAAVRELGFGQRRVSPALFAFTMQMLDASEVGMLVGFLDTLTEHDRYAALAALRRCEVLVLGAERDRITALEQAKRIADALPGAEFVAITGAGHLAMLERPDLVNAHLIGLVRRCLPKLGLRRRLDEPT